MSLKKSKMKEKLLEELFSMLRAGIKPGLERTLTLSGRMGNPHNQLNAIHIAGTNGKGSVSSMIASVLTSAGFRVGLYTSPHINNFNERIRINGKMITDDELVELAEEVIAIGKSIDATFFEITTVIAYKYFVEKQVDFAVIETGMGGRYDSTNIIDPLMSIITKIDMDHMEYLGNTIEKIAFEKCGIMKKDKITIISPDNEPAWRIIEHEAIQRESRILFSQDKIKIKNVRNLENLEMVFHAESKKRIYGELKLPLAGKHQINNAITALFAIENLIDMIDFSNIGNKRNRDIIENSRIDYTKTISIDDIRNGFNDIKENTGICRRIELVIPEMPLVVDVAHNENSIKSLIKTLKTHYPKITKWNMLIAIMKDKEIDAILSYLKGNIGKLFATQVQNNDRCLSSNELCKRSILAGVENIVEIENSKVGLSKLIDEGAPAIIFGSFYLMGELTEEINKIKSTHII